MADRTLQRDKDKQAQAQRRADEANAAEADAPAHPLLHLQRQLGNAQVARMLAQREPALQREPEEEELQMQRDPAIQREGEQGEAEEEEIQLQRDDGPEVGMEGGPISDGLSSRIQSMRGSGSPLEEGTRASMEASFNTSFDDVRVHTGGEAASVSRSLGAKAFTSGSNVVFGSGASPSDTGLVAHELTHVVQQRGMSPGGPMRVSAAGDAHEQEADAMSAAVTNTPAPAQRTEEE